MDPDWWTRGSTRTELWYVWLEIAVGSEARAAAARSDAFRARDKGGSVPAALETETKATMVAAVASAAAIENIANNLKEFLETPVTADTAAQRAIKVTEAVFGAVVSQGIQADVRWLFGFRNET